MSKETDVGYLETACEECGHRVVRYGVISQNELTHLREQNRVLLEALVKCERELSYYYPRLPTQGRLALEAAKAALTATSQPQPPYKEWCRHPEKCAGLASCPQDPTCAD